MTIDLRALSAVADALRAHPRVRDVVVRPGKPTTAATLNKARKAGVAGATLDVYGALDGFEIHWRSDAIIPRIDEPLSGHIKLLPLAKVLGSWKGVVFFDDTDQDSSLRSFCPIDFFVDEACVGTTKKGSQVQFHDFHDEPRGLGIDLAGYLELLVQSRGAWYWQRALLDHERGREGPAVLATLAGVFPDFDPAAFLARYDALRAAYSAWAEARTKSAEAALPPPAVVANDPAAKARDRWNALHRELRALPGLVGNHRCDVSTMKPSDKGIAEMKRLGYPKKLIAFDTKSWFRCFTLRWQAMTSSGEAWGLHMTDEGRSLDWDPPLGRYEKFSTLPAFPAACVTRDELGIRRGIETMDGYLPGDASVSHFVAPDAPPLRLDLDQDGYFETMWLSRGYVGWQRVIHALSRGEESDLTGRFRADMKELFPWFDWAAYVASYQARRLTR